MHTPKTTWLYTGSFDAAEVVYAEIVDTQKEILGPDHPSTLSSQTFVARCKREQGECGGQHGYDRLSNRMCQGGRGGGGEGGDACGCTCACWPGML